MLFIVIVSVAVITVPVMRSYMGGQEPVVSQSFATPDGRASSRHAGAPRKLVAARGYGNSSIKPTRPDECPLEKIRFGFFG